MSVLLAVCIVLGASRPQNPLDGDGGRYQCDGRKSVLVGRLIAIDAPELKHYGAIRWEEQPRAKEAAAHLREVCPVGSSAIVRIKGYDRSKRALVDVECSGGNASEEQAKAGYAWTFMAPKGSVVPALVEEARTAHRGLWADPAPIAPSVWRKAGACAI